MSSWKGYSETDFSESACRSRNEMTAKEAWNEKSIPTRRPLMLYGACAPKNSKPGIKKRECEKLMR